MWDGDIIENFDLQKLDSVEDLEKEINDIEKNEYKPVPVPLQEAILIAPLETQPEKAILKEPKKRNDHRRMASKSKVKKENKKI